MRLKDSCLSESTLRFRHLSPSAEPAHPLEADFAFWRLEEALQHAWLKHKHHALLKHSHTEHVTKLQQKRQQQALSGYHANVAARAAGSLHTVSCVFVAAQFRITSGRVASGMWAAELTNLLVCIRRSCTAWQTGRLSLIGKHNREIIACRCAAAELLLVPLGAAAQVVTVHSPQYLLPALRDERRTAPPQCHCAAQQWQARYNRHPFCASAAYKAP